MLLSIVIPVYNVEKYIRECLDSIIKQVNEIEEKIEIILVDDGSKDESGNICDKYVEKYKDLIKVFHNTNKGLLLTRRFGYSKAIGQYVVNCDSDDSMELGAIRKILNIIKNDEPDVIIYNVNKYDGKIKIPFFKNIFTKQKTISVDKNAVIFEYLNSYSIVSMCSKCYKRSYININQDYSDFALSSNGEDTLESLEIFEKAQSFFYLNEELYNYRCSSGMTSKFDKYYFSSFCSILNEIEKSTMIKLLPDYNKMLASKFFSFLGRAITQCRFAGFEKRLEYITYFSMLRKNQFIDKFWPYYTTIKYNLQKDYEVLIWLLYYENYRTIMTLLQIKNKLDKWNQSR